MSNWIPCAGRFITADVIRWTEGDWERRGRRRGRDVKLGDRLVTAQVVREDDGGWVYLLVLESAVVSEKQGRRVTLLPKKQEVRRKRTTVARGKAERLAWSDETARAVVASKFLGIQQPDAETQRSVTTDPASGAFSSSPSTRTGRGRPRRRK